MTTTVHYFYGGHGNDERYVRCQIDTKPGATLVALVGNGWRAEELVELGCMIQSRVRIPLNIERVWEMNEDLREGTNDPAKMTEASYGATP